MGSVGVCTGIAVCSILLLMQLPAYSATKEKRQLPCTHTLRLSVPSLFTHCNNAPQCKYSKWSSWVPNSAVLVPVSQCPTGKAYQEERTRTSEGSGCTEPLRETQTICLPDQEDLLILTLGLGNTGHNYNLIPQPRGPPYTVRRLNLDLSGVVDLPQPTESPVSKCPEHGTNGRICHNIPGIGKRSVKEDIKLPKSKENIISSNLKPIPFDWDEHGPRLRQKRQSFCNHNDVVQYVLFVLDTSGSIGKEQFDRMKRALGKLTPLFCKQVKFALITFSTYVNLEFCFDCFENTYDGRRNVQEAIMNATYQGRGTNTAGTAKCICDEIIGFDSSCGIDPFPLQCIDVVFITDGKSNDPNLEICDEIRCIHSRYGVNTYAIGINSGTGFTPSYNRTELECISHFSNLQSPFEFESFESFETSIENIIFRLVNAVFKSKDSCLKPNLEISPTGVPPKDPQ